MKTVVYIRIPAIILAVFFSINILTGCSTQLFLSNAGPAAAAADNAARPAAPVVNNAIYSNDYIIDEGPVRGGAVRVYATAPDTYNALLTRNSYANAMFGLIYEGLATIGPYLTVECGLAERWAPSVDGMVWYVVLRDGVKWHDGRPLKAYDVVGTIDKIRSYGEYSPYADLIENIRSAAAMSELEIRLELIKENAFTPYTLTFPIIPSHVAIDALDGMSGDANMGAALIGTGPYRYAGHDKEKSVTLEAANTWHGAMDSAETQPPYIQEVQFIFHDPRDTALSRFRERDVDLFFSKTINYSRYQSSSELRIRQYSEREFLFVSMNYNKGMTAAKSVRRALLRMLDRKKLIGEALDGRGIAAEYPVQPESLLYGDGITGTPYDPQAARSILENAGFRLDDGVFYGDVGNGWRSLELSMLVNAGDAERCALADKMADMFRDNGVVIKVIREQADEIAKKITGGEYEMALIGYRTQPFPDMTELYSTPWQEGKQPVNPARYQNDEADRISHELFTVYDEADRMTAFSELTAILRDDAPYLGICFRASALVHGEDMRGGIYPCDRNPLNMFAGWYISDYR